jgi:hypothetical protein
MRLGVLATLSKPEVLRMGNPIPPAEVLEAIERDLAKGTPFCFPTPGPSSPGIMRRFAPDLVWSWLHRIEGQ